MTLPLQLLETRKSMGGLALQYRGHAARAAHVYDGSKAMHSLCLLWEIGSWAAAHDALSRLHSIQWSIGNSQKGRDFGFAVQ